MSEDLLCPSYIRTWVWDETGDTGMWRTERCSEALHLVYESYVPLTTEVLSHDVYPRLREHPTLPALLGLESATSRHWRVECLAGHVLAVQGEDESEQFHPDLISGL